MTLDQAIERVLQEAQRPMTSKEIAAIIGARKMFVRQDMAPLPSSQVAARVSNFEQIFTFRNGKIGLVKNDPVSLRFEKYKRQVIEKMKCLYKTGEVFDREEILKGLLDQIKNEDFEFSTDEDEDGSEAPS